MGPVAIGLRRCVWVAGACAALLAFTAVPAATAAPAKRCSTKQVYAGKCGNLSTRSCLSMIPASKFGPVTVSTYLMYDDPDWVPIATHHATISECGAREELIPPMPNTPGAVLVTIGCSPPLSSSLPPTPTPTACQDTDVATIQLAREPSARSAQLVLTQNFCSTQPFIGRLVYVQGAGRKACVNYTTGAGYMAADNYFVAITGFTDDDTALTPTQALKIIATKLLT